MKHIKSLSMLRTGPARRQRWRPRSLLALARAATMSSTSLFPRLGVATVLAAVGVADVARAAQTGELGGIVLDENAEPLAGVRVILTSPQMIGGARETTTDVDGGFRFPGLDPGDYTITLSSPAHTGFEEKAIHVGVNARVEREYLLEKAKDVAGAEKVIKVVAKRPVVDPTRTSLGTTITSELTDRTATSRDYQGVALLAPGVVNGATAGGNPSIHGGTPFSNVYLLDGLNITDPVTQTFSTNFNFDAIGELEIITGGLDAEYGNTTGGLLNIVTKSGGDEFELDASIYSSPRELQLLDPGEERNNDELNINLSVGGPIIKKKLWFFLAGQYIDNLSEVAVTTSPFGADFKVPPRRFNAFYGLGKLKWQVAPWQKLTLLMQGDPTTITNEGQSAFVANEAQSQRFQGGVKVVLTSETTLSENLLWKTQLGYGSDQLYLYPMSCDGDFLKCANESTPGRTNQETQTATVNATTLADDRRYRLIANTALSYFLDGFLGDHEFKVGLEGTLTFQSTNDWVPGKQVFTDRGIAQAGSSISGAGDPFERTDYPEPLQKTVGANLVTVFAQDTWRPTKGVTIRPGLRFDSSRGYDETGVEVFQFNSLSPRVGAAWDPFGDGKTVVRGGYYFYNETGLLLVPSFVGRGLASTTYGFNPETGQYDIFKRSAGGDSGVTFKPGMVPPNQHEIIFGVQREIADNTAFGIDFTYRRRQNMFEDDESNIIWNARGDNAVGFRNNAQQFIFSVGTPAESMGEYVGVDFIFDKRLADNWESYVTYTLARLQGTNENLVTYAFDNPTQRPFEYGYLADDVRHQLKGTLTYDLPYGFQIGGTAQYFSGRPLTKFFFNNFYGDYLDKRAPSGFDPKDVDNPDDDVEFRTPDVFRLDARFAWRLRELTNQDIWLIADVFNLFNTRPPVDFEVRDLPPGGATQFGDVLGRGSPLQAQVALRYMF
jgi:hypothetical protein